MKLPKEYEQKVAELARLKAQEVNIKSKVAKLRDELITVFEANDIKKFDNDSVNIRYVESTNRMRIDTKALKQRHPNAYIDCLKAIPYDSMIIVTLKDK